jgi:ribose transport system permease protein
MSGSSTLSAVSRAVGVRSRREVPAWGLSALLLAVLLVVYLIFAPGSTSLFAFNGTIRTSLPLILLALGQTIVLISGGIDLSVGALACLCSAVAVQVVTADASPGAVLSGALLVLLVGAAGGALNALAIAFFRLQPIIATFGSSFVFGGLALVIQPAPGGEIPLDLVLAFNADNLFISNTILITVVVLLAWGLVMRTRFRDFLYATGASPQTAFSSAVPVRRVRSGAFILAGVFAALAAMALVLTTGTADPTAGLTLVLPAVVAAIVGGTSLSGGQGGLLGTVFAALSLGLLQTMISIASIPPTWQQLAYGVAILVALSLNSLRLHLSSAATRKALRKEALQ